MFVFSDLKIKFELSLIVGLLQTTEPFQHQTVTLTYHFFMVFYMKKIYFFVVVSNVPVKLIALALLTSISMPPNFFTASWTVLEIAPSSRMSTAQGRHFPPASSTTSKIIPISHTVHLAKPSAGLLMCAVSQVVLLYHATNTKFGLLLQSYTRSEYLPLVHVTLKVPNRFLPIKMCHKLVEKGNPRKQYWRGLFLAVNVCYPSYFVFMNFCHLS